MIKILFFIETLRAGGAEKVLCDLVNHMDRSRFEITVQTVWRQDPREYLVPGIRYKYMYSSQNTVNRMRYRAEAAAGIAYRLHIKDDYDIECAYLEMGPTKVIAQSDNKKAVKLAWVHCDLSRKVGDVTEFVKKTKDWYSRFDKVACVSESVRESFVKMFAMQERTEIIYNVVDDDSIRRKSLEHDLMGLLHRKFTLLSVGRLTEEKNFIRLLSAHKQLLDEGFDHDLWILGDGPDRPMLEQYVAQNHLEESVFMPGFAENPYPFMREADLLACSSNYEGFSTFLTEGLILGKPIVSTEVSGVRELLGNSEFGLVTENDDEAFYAGLKRMATDAALAGHYAHKAAERGAQFSLNKLVAENERFLKTCCKGLKEE